MLKTYPHRPTLVALTALVVACSGPTSPSDGQEMPGGVGGDSALGGEGSQPQHPAGGSLGMNLGGEGSGGDASGGSGLGGAGLGGEASGGESSGGAGVGGEGSGGAASGGTGSGGDGSGGDAAGGSGSGGEASGGAASGGAATGGDGSGGSGGGEQPLVRFDYFHDGSHIRSMSENGDIETVLEAPGTAPKTMVFPEADVDTDGLFSRRRQSALAWMKGSFHRLDGEASAVSPPAPLQVTTISNANTLCGWQPISPPGAREESHLLLSYSAGVSCATGIQYVRLPLLADAEAAPLPWDGKTQQVRDSYGNLDGYLRLDDGILAAVASYEDAAPIEQLLPLIYVATYYLHPLDDGSYFLMVMKSSTLWDLYHYDTSDHSVTGPLAQNVSSFSGPSGHRNQSDDALFFTATTGGTTKIYRLKKDGSTNLEALEGQTGSLRVIGVVDDELYFSVGGATAVTYRIAADADFASAPTPTLLLGDTGAAPVFLSEDRLFYTRHINSVDKRIGTIKLDGTEQEEVPNVSLIWIGCDNDESTDYPNAVDTGLCSRVHAAGYFYTGDVRSYSSYPGGTGFFTDGERGPVSAGSLTPEPTYFSSALTNRTGMGALGQEFISFQTAGTLFGINPPSGTYYQGIFMIPQADALDPALTKFWTNGVNTVWLN